MVSESKRKIKSLILVYSALIIITLIILFLIVLFSPKNWIKEDFGLEDIYKRFNDSLSSIKGGILTKGNKTIGESCSNDKDCSICKLCDSSIKECVEMDKEIDPDYCEPGVYDGYKSSGEFICVSGICAYKGCMPDCRIDYKTFKQCGPDGCNGNCGECRENEVCTKEGLCENDSSIVNRTEINDSEDNLSQDINKIEKPREKINYVFIVLIILIISGLLFVLFLIRYKVKKMIEKN
jgi:hypothetical protein